MFIGGYQRSRRSTKAAVAGDAESDGALLRG